MGYRVVLALGCLWLFAVSGCSCERFPPCADPSECSEGTTCHFNQCLPLDADGRVMEPCDRQGTVRACSSDVGACEVGDQTCRGGFWTPCTGVVPAAYDVCTPLGTAYAGNEALDLTCDGLLTAHPPRAVPSLVGPGVTPIAPVPTGFAAAYQAPTLATLTLSAAGEDDFGDTSFSFRWRLIAAPAENSQGLSGAPGASPSDVTTEATPLFAPTVTGEYVVGVVALNGAGCPSPEVKLSVKVRPASSIHFQLTWAAPVDMDVRFAKAAGPSAPSFDDGGACYFFNTNPDWTGDTYTRPVLDKDDPAGCNPETISYGVGDVEPRRGSTYSVFAHYFCNRRGHQYDPFVRTAVCYEPTTYDTPVAVTLKVFINGELHASFSDALVVSEVWKVADVLYDANGAWVITPGADPKFTRVKSECANDARASCVCEQLTNPSDPYCGTAGAACRQRYP